MPLISIGNQIIDLPNTGRDAVWSEGVIDAIQALADGLAAVNNQFDISSRVQILTNDANTNLDITDAIFPAGSVRAFSFFYSVYRESDSTSIAEEGYVEGVYDTAQAMWTLEHAFTGPRQSSGEAYNTFSMSGDQLQISTVAIGGAYNSTDSTISYSAKTLQVSD